MFSIGTACAAAVLYGPTAEFFAVDRCLDQGGRWNYELGGCEGARGQLEALVPAEGLDLLSLAVAVIGALAAGLAATAMISLVLHARERWFAV